LTKFVDILSIAANFIGRITDGCVDSTKSFVCNAIFVPCDLATGEAKDLCTNSCNKFEEDCKLVFDSLLLGAVLFERIILENYCTDTLMLIKKVAGTNTTVSGVECNCFDIHSM